MSLCMETREVHGGDAGVAAARALVVDIGAADVGELVVDGCAADDGAVVGELIVDVGSADVEADNVGADDVADAVKALGANAVKELGAGAVKGLGADAVRELGADAVKELGAGVVKELGADAVKELGADDVGVDDVMVSDESVVGVIVNIAAGTETVGTATPAVFLSTRSGFSVPAGGAGLLSVSSGADVGLVANLRGGVGGCETLTTAAKY